MTPPAPRLAGVICTYRRPDAIVAMLDALHRQQRRPDPLLVVDNADDASTRRVVEGHPIATEVTCWWIGAGENLGPAGAFRLAIQSLCDELDDDDLVVLFDDDDPPTDATVLADLVAAAAELAGPSFGGVGLRGGRLRRGRGTIAPVPGAAAGRLVPADHLHGGWLPVYRIGACRVVPPFDPTLFWGFEELEFGLRLTDAGYTLHCAADVWRRVAPPGDKRQSERFVLRPPTWRDYYRHRNLLAILRRRADWRAIAFTVLVRLTAKPLVLLWRSPPAALANLRLAARVVADARRDPLPDRRAELVRP